MVISTSAIGLPTGAQGIFLASGTLNNWCQGDYDFSEAPRLQLDSDGQNFIIDAEKLLNHGDEFKLVIPHFGAENAARAYANRMDAEGDTFNGEHIDRRFDYDPNTGHFWLLAHSHQVIRPGLWNQNNVYS